MNHAENPAAALRAREASSEKVEDVNEEWPGNVSESAESRRARLKAPLSVLGIEIR